jgi:hypothetical protein
MSLRFFCFLFLVTSVYSDYVAVFLNATETDRCLSRFDQGLLYHKQCDHSTISFNPPSMSQYTPLLGRTIYMDVLLDGADSHCQAVLVTYTPSSTRSTNRFAHITIVDENTKPYTAVYSNVMWDRFNQSGALVQNGNWSGVLDNFNSDGFLFPTTTGRVLSIDIPFRLTGTLCLNSQWNRSSARCSVAPIPIAQSVTWGDCTSTRKNNIREYIL